MSRLRSFRRLRLFVGTAALVLSLSFFVFPTAFPARLLALQSAWIAHRLRSNVQYPPLAPIDDRSRLWPPNLNEPLCKLKLFVYDIPSSLDLTVAQRDKCRWSAYSSEIILHSNLGIENATDSHFDLTRDPTVADFFFVPLFPACFLFNCWSANGGWDLTKRCRVDQDYILPILNHVHAAGYWKQAGYGPNHMLPHPMDRVDDYYEKSTRDLMRNNSIYLITSGDRRPLPYSRYNQLSTDIVVPSATHLLHSYRINPRDYVSGPPLVRQQRSIEVLFRGAGSDTLGDDVYSLSIRDLFFPSRDHRGFSSLPGYSIAHSSTNEEYAHALAHSRFGLVPPGFTLDSTRLYEYLAFGVVPVFIGTGHRGGQIMPFENDIDWASLSVFISRADAHQLPEILGRILSQDYKKMQANVIDVATAVVLAGERSNVWNMISRELCRRKL